MRELSIVARANKQNLIEDEFEFRVFAAELAEALAISADELVEAIEADQVNCREVESGNGEFVAEIEVLDRRCRLRVRNLM